MTGSYELYCSTAQLSELDEVLNRPALRRLMRPAARPADLIQALWEAAHPLSIRLPYPTFPRDPRDSFLLAMLRDGPIDLLVTEDKDLLSLKHYCHAEIVTIGQFHRRLARSRKS